MAELETLKAFFQSWESLQAMPKAKGRPSPEKKAAEDLVQMMAAAVRGWKPQGAAQTGNVQAVQSDYMALRQQVSAIPPASTHGPRVKGERDITNG